MHLNFNSRILFCFKRRRNESKKRKAKQHAKEKEYMKALKEVKETGIYRPPTATISSGSCTISTPSSEDEQPAEVKFCGRKQ